MLETLQRYRKLLYGLSLTIGVLGILVSWVLLFYFYSSIGTLEVSLTNQIEATDSTLAEVETSLTTVEAALSAFVPLPASNLVGAVQNQRSELTNLRQSMSDVFSTLRLIVLLLVFIIDILFVILGINSVAGLLAPH
ncbi:MAG TPA: hypothetical protein VJH24_03915 [Candidatus Bilamarchaeaceae archaeon]|nr:hypothetical protein [Candidatus Bilamarchaeaceae archaeon]